MSIAASFLAGAKSRLLPADIPFRFFVACSVLHVLMWLALLLAAGQATSFRGGLGPALAAVHLLTLGVLTTAAIGASAQLLPVATRRALVAVWPLKLTFWLVVPGLIGLVLAMAAVSTALLVAAALATTAGLLLFAAVTADNLRRAGSLPVVAAYGWAALAALVAVVGLGLALSLNYGTGWLPDHSAAALAHMLLGGFGFMGLLVLGFSHVLVPMFALSAAPAKTTSRLGFVLAVLAVALGSAGALADSREVLAAAALLGLAAAALHIRLMQQALAGGMRKRLGLSFVLIRLAWALLALTLIVGLAALYGLAGPNGATLFGFLLIGGWLLTFLLGILQRIVPFLASMHMGRSAAGGPLMSEIAGSQPLKLHAACHVLALALVAAGIAGDAVWLVRLGSAAGLAGALAYGWFMAGVARRVAVRDP